MTANMGQATALTLVGRNGSHFTRIARMFAREVGVRHQYRQVGDLQKLDAECFAGNPALKLPVLEGPGGTRVGTLNICRELARCASPPPRIIWPEDQRDALSCNALELTLQGMATEVHLIMHALSGAPADCAALVKPSASLEQSVRWLDANLAEVLAALPDNRGLSFLEVALFCFASHLPWRGVLPLDPYPNLRSFCAEYGQRPSAAETPYEVTPSPS
jgi:glutathione S-transferase